MVLPRRRRRAHAGMAHQQALAEQLLPLRQVSRAPARVHRSLERSLISLLYYLVVIHLDLPLLVSSVSVPVILSGTSFIPPATAVNYIPWAVAGFIFNYLVRKRHFSWWAKYNCKSAGAVRPRP